MSAPETTLYTRCPGCATIFRVSPQQLALREGQVRCGHCRAVFDAHRERVSLDAPRGDDDDHDELAAGRPTVTLRSAEALQPVEPKGESATKLAETASSSIETAQAPAAPVETEQVPVASAATAEAVTDASSKETTTSSKPEASVEETAAAEPAEAPIRIDDSGLRASRFEWKPRKPLRERPRSLYATALVVLVLALVAQALFEYRDALAAHAPFTRPVLEAACSAFGCDVGPLRDAGALSIDASDLRADPAHKGLLELSATIRNRADYPIAWPYLELTLTDVSERVVARRAFPPSEYAGAGADVAHGIPANGEDVVRLFLDASATSQSGYRLYLFYP
ncbi:MAG TPA: zinc-ribbon and DUF3426 domain-containing protein [Casimicrobiaceae bacterium]